MSEVKLEPVYEYKFSVDCQGEKFISENYHTIDEMYVLGSSIDWRVIEESKRERG